MFYEFGDAAGVLKLRVLSFPAFAVGGALVGEGDGEALVKKCEFAQALGERVVVVFDGGEDFLIGKEMNFGAALLGGAGLLEFRNGNALGVALLPYEAVAPDFEIELV